MPIHFRCQHCNARLSVSSRKAGVRAKCPKCGDKITIPTDGDATDGDAAGDDATDGNAVDDDATEGDAARGSAAQPPSVSPPAEPPIGNPLSCPVVPSLSPLVDPPLSEELGSRVAPSAGEPPADETRPSMSPTAIDPLAVPLAAPPPIAEPAADPFAEFVVYDDAELVYEVDGEPQIGAQARLPFDPAKVAVRRDILYLQGALLAVVALVSFALGILAGAGGGSSGRVEEQRRPCEIVGRIVLRTRTDDTLPDPGAVAIVLPQDARPEAKLQIVGLRPQDPPLPEDHATLRMIRSLGGSYARADSEGRFRLQVPDRGNYYLLVVSATRRNSQAELPTTALAQLGRYFQLAPDLFGGYDHQWQAETVRSDRQLSFVF